MSDKTTFTDWLAQVALREGYDLTPGEGGRSKLAKAMGVDPSVVGKIFTSPKSPAIDTQRRLAEALNVKMSEMLIRSGTLRSDELPQPGEAPPAPTSKMDLYAAAAEYGIPPERADLFVKSVEAVAKTFANGQNRLS